MLREPAPRRPATTTRAAPAAAERPAAAAAAHPAHARLLQLQRDAGNAAVAGALVAGERVKVWLNTFIPMRSVGLVDPSYVQVTPDLPYGMTGYARTPQVQWAGDNRDFSEHIHASSRTHQELEFDVATGAITLQWKQIGTSHLLDPFSDAPIATATASDAGEVTTLTRAGSTYQVQMVVDATNPLMPGAPAINADVTVTIDPAARTATITGRHDGFPAYEVYVGSATGTHRLYGYDPRAAAETPNALFPPMDKVATGTAAW